MNATELAKLVVAELYGGSGPWLFLICALVFAGAGAYLGQYLGAKGKNLATKEDFQALQSQLHANTTLVEGIKTEIAHADWVKREWSALRVKKIEDLMTLVLECDTYLERLQLSLFIGQTGDDTDPLDRTTALAGLYLPELLDQVKAYVALCRARKIALLQTSQKVLEKKQGDLNYGGNSEWEAFMSDTEQSYGQLRDAGNAVRTSAAKLLRGIVGAQ